MSSTTIGPAKKETVYDGPAIAPRRSGSGHASQFGASTVYPGSQGGTVFSGASVPTGDGGSDTKIAAKMHDNVIRAGRLFYYIAGLSALNTILAVTGAGFAMAVGLGVSRAFNGFLAQGQWVPVIVFNGAASALFLLIGNFTRQGSKPALITGAVLYGLDLVFLCMAGIAQQAPSVAVHGFFLLRMLLAMKELD